MKLAEEEKIDAIKAQALGNFKCIHIEMLELFRKNMLASRGHESQSENNAANA
jgi:hypothetical protein